MGDGSPGPGGGGRRRPGRDHETTDERSVWRSAGRWIATSVRGLATASRGDLSGAELRHLVANSRALDREERRLIDEVLAAGDRHVRELMVPRTEAVFLDAAMTIDEAVQVARATPHSRFPVVDGSHDDVTGFVHLRDLTLRPEGEGAVAVGEIARPVRRLPAAKLALVALSEMRRAGDHLAVVVDEYGGTAGIVTLEDLIEELVGEIHDEYDAAPTGADGTLPSEVEGLVNLADFAERVGVVLPSGPYDTVGGYVMAALGRLPEAGDEVTVSGWRLFVLGMDGRRVARVGITPPRDRGTDALPAPAVGAIGPAAAEPARAL